MLTLVIMGLGAVTISPRPTACNIFFFLPKKKRKHGSGSCMLVVNVINNFYELIKAGVIVEDIAKFLVF